MAAHVYRLATSAAVHLRLPQLWLRSRPDELRQRLGNVPELPGSIWLHAASVGELGAAAPLIETLSASVEAPVALSVMTRTGLARARELSLTAEPFHPPLDATGPVRRAADRLRPTAWIALETEIWPTLLRELGDRGVPTGIVSARMPERGIRRFRRGRSLFEPVLRQLAAVGARTEADADGFRRLGVPPAAVRVTGDLKEDRPVPDRVPAPETARWIAACTRPGEEEELLDALRVVRSDVPRGVLLIAPRHPERFEEVAALLSRSEFPVRRWRDSSAGGADDGWSIVLIDEMGVLDGAYRESACAFVGGSLRPFRGHSPWEAAVAGRPVIMGPDTSNCATAFDRLESGGAATRVATARELGERVAHWLTRPEEAERAGRAAHRIAREASGAARNTIDFLRERRVIR